ncbi:alpha/beta hydrolase [Prauserella sp. PE36]|uniref:Alpha/beta hydrolase n=1 Tax=Prauserella endophytica TaxID=1592324 RepID=A0ABY2RYJ4_9PSEU|nr:MULTISPECIES: alpha/beta hydrolase [Prauserella]PXY24834.1 3-oxoadipate enol-lactonase [Prauserella coralliicola]RBM22896.1 alpha/beta hydrolase [Prauserella sp. PE36]TKG65259.1 alpha/beta hydrolase [Prauserella endophytica]
MIEAAYTDIGGTLSYVEQSGTGRPVLCLHTAGQSGVQWRHTTAALAALGYRVVVPDLPGHGRSEPAPGGPVTDLGDYAAWCETLIGALGLRRPFVVGCSIGGKIALDLAVRMGERLAGVVAMAAEAGPGHIGLAGLRRELEDVAAPSRADRTHLGTLAVVGRKVTAERAGLIATMHRREDPAVSTSDLLGWGTHDVRAGLARVRCPVHVVAGADDLWLDLAAVRATAAAVPGARCTILDGIGHYPMEELEDFAATLHGWLSGLGGTR